MGYTRGEVVAETGINEGYLSSLINRGKDNPSAWTLRRLSLALRVPIDAFRNYALDKPPPVPHGPYRRQAPYEASWGLGPDSL